MNAVILTQEIIESFTAHLRCDEKSPYTIEKYIRDVRAFMLYAGDRSLSKELTLAYKSHLIESGQYGKASINSMLASVGSLLDYVGRPDCKVSNLRIQKSLYRPEERNLEKSEYIRLKAAAKGKPRLYLILETLFSTGIRISELKYFTVESLQERNICVSCKNKTRTIILPSELRKRLLVYAKKSGITSGVIFRTRSGKPVNRSNVWAQMKNLCQKAEVAKSKVFPHNLRKLFARMFYELSKDIAQLADLLGHSSINTTRIYIMTTENAVRDKIERLTRLILSEEKRNTTLSE